VKNTIFVLGAGSAGTRHFETLNKLGAEVRILSRRTDEDELQKRFSSSQGWGDAASIIVATESYQHENALLAIAESGFEGSVLVEKPGIANENNLQKMKRLHVKIAYNLRFLEGLEYVKAEVDASIPLTASIVSKSDLTTWRKDWSRPDQYSRSAALSGGVLFDMSHELDYAIDIFGVPDFLTGVGGRLGNVTIDSDDSWKIVASYKRGLVVSIDLSYLSHLNDRSLGVQLENKTVSLNLLTGHVEDSKSGQFSTNAISSTYELMMRNWLDNGGSRLPSMEDNLETLKLIKSIRRLEAVKR